MDYRTAKVTIMVTESHDPKKVNHHGHYGSDYAYAHPESEHRDPEIEVTYREQREADQDKMMSPAAQRARGAGNRETPEDPDNFRTCFERDSDRIKHSAPFRRLAGKTQVVFAPDNDHVRTRLTHAIEVTQVAVSISRIMRLNEALTEAIGLAHDIGHGPAGHTAEEAFSPYLEGGYDHAQWGANVILAPYNLTNEVLDGIRNGPWRRPAPISWEAEVVSLADRIAYLCHDLEDAYRANIITPADFPKELGDALGVDRRTQIKTLITAVVDGANETGRICMKEPYGTLMRDFRAWNYENIYMRPASERERVKAVRMLSALVEALAANPTLIPQDAVAHDTDIEPNSTEAFRSSVTYVAGMTDRFAAQSAQKFANFPVEDLPQPV